MGRVYIYLHEWLIFIMANVGKYISPMDGMGYSNILPLRKNNNMEY